MKINTKTARSMAFLLWLAGLMIFPNPGTLFGEEDQTFVQREQAWRANRDEEMRSPTSWLNIAGLFWLKEGENGFGTAESNPIKLPKGSAPLFAGKYILKNDTITVIAEKGVAFKVEERLIDRRALKGDDTGKPDVILLNSLRMWVIKRFGRYAIRLRDLNHPPFLNYQRLNFFPPAEKFKLEAEFHPFPELKKMEVGTVLGEYTVMDSPGYVVFRIDGKEYRLDAFSARPKKLFFIFGDETNGEETYEASRFLEADILNNGKVDLNFNRAYNPPCAYTSYATCPLPPPQNQLKIAIRAGEKKYPDSHH